MPPDPLDVCIVQHSVHKLSHCLAGTLNWWHPQIKCLNIDDKALSHSIPGTVWAKFWSMTARVDGHTLHMWRSTHQFNYGGQWLSEIWYKRLVINSINQTDEHFLSLAHTCMVYCRGYGFGVWSALILIRATSHCKNGDHSSFRSWDTGVWL